MKLVETDKLKLGDWILMGGEKMKGKFKVAKLQAYDFEEYEELDINKGDIKIIGKGSIRNGGKESDGVYNVLNKKEIKALNILRTKLKTLKGLEDNKLK